MKNLFKKIIITLIFSSELCSLSYGEKQMLPLFNLNLALMKKLEPEIYSTKKKEISGIFDIPIDNAIASNSVPGTNAITLITFKNGKVKYKTIIKNFKSYVSGGLTNYLPIFSKEWIGYSQNRGFSLINIKNKKTRYYSLAGGFDYVIGNVGVIDGEKKIISAHISSYNKTDPDLIRIFDLNTEEGNCIEEKKFKKGFMVSSDNFLFFCSRNELKAFDKNLKEVIHPLVTIYEKEKFVLGRILCLIASPIYPFAIFASYDYEKKKEGTYIVNWKSGEAKITRLFDLAAYFFQFSYDNKWLILEVPSEEKNKYIIMPCGEEYPNFFGKPILLGDVPEFPSGGGVTAVTRNPAGFVIPEKTWENHKRVNRLIKWDFTKTEELIEKE